MERTILKSKIHRATVTEADLEYEGSLTLDKDLMEAADLMQFEMIQVYNITNGERFETYIIEGGSGTGTICINGAAARRAHVGDKIIIASYVSMTDKEAKTHHPTIVVVDEHNKPVWEAVRGKLKPLNAKKGKKGDSWLLEP